VKFDAAKTEAILFTKKKDKRHPKMKIELGNGKEVPYHKGATRWLGFWMDLALNFNEHFTNRMAKVDQREVEIKRLYGNYGMNPCNIRTITMATIQTTALFGSEIWWPEKGQPQRSEEVQKNAKRTSQGNHRMYENHSHRCTHGRSKHNPGSGSAKLQTMMIRR
jgi:hypothetical protein